MKQAVILVGGAGTRLGAMTTATPKPLLPIAGKPFLEHLLDEIARYGSFEQVLLLAGHFGGQVAERYDGRTWRDVTLRVVVEHEPLGTGGALKNAAAHLDPQFVLMNGDSFLDFNLLDLVTAVPLPGTRARLALLSGHPDDRYGRVELAGGRAIAFRAPSEMRSGPINAGVYVLDRAMLDLVPYLPASLERDVLPGLAQRGELMARIYDGYFIDIGIPTDFAKADSELGTRLSRPAAFFDRDGVLNRDIGYAHRSEQIDWIDGAKDAIKACNDAGMLVFVVTNQAGVARGFYAESDIVALHRWMNGELATVGAHVDEFVYCPHHPEGTVEAYRQVCACRKPGSGMLENLLRRWNVDLGRSFMIGDKPSDVAAGTAAGVRSVLFDGKNLRELVRRLRSESGAGQL